MTYLADTSAWTNVRKSAASWSAWTHVMRAGEVRGAAPVLLELLRGARNAAEARRYRTAFAALGMLAVAEAEWERALEVQELLADRGSHRGVTLVDLIIAAAAEHAGVTLLHYDKDFDLIAGVTGQPTEWITPRGSL